MVQLTSIHDYWKSHSFDYMDFCHIYRHYMQSLSLKSLKRNMFMVLSYRPICLLRSVPTPGYQGFSVICQPVVIRASTPPTIPEHVKLTPGKPQGVVKDREA